MSEPLVQIAVRQRLPEWARKSSTHFESLHRLKSELRRRNLHTVCESARCPNIHECFHRGAATFMILGERCTRGCGFCSVPKLRPHRDDPRLDPAEPANVARMAAEMGLRYVVLTSVNRDDLEDGGSHHFAQTVREVRQALPAARVEVLTPDFCGSLEAVARVLDAAPHVFNHNMETVPRLYRRVRPQADYRQSLDVLSFARRHRAGAPIRAAHAPVETDQELWALAHGSGVSPHAPDVPPHAAEAPPNAADVPPHAAGTPPHAPGAPPHAPGLPPHTPGVLTKSGFMVGLGETEAEVHELLRDLREAGVGVATIGQYLQPTRRNLPVTAYIEPRQFEAYREYGLALGFQAVFSGPLVRSSYMADIVNDEAHAAERQ